MAQLREPQFDGTCPCVPIPITIDIALVGSLGAALARCGAAQRAGLKRHQAISRKTDHLAQKCRVRALLQQLAKGDLVLGNRRGPRVRVACCSSTLPGTAAVNTAVDMSPPPRPDS